MTTYSQGNLITTMRSIIALHTAPSIPGGSKGQALRFCLSDLVIMKDVPAARGRHDFGLDLGEQTLNAKGAGLHGCWVLSRAAPVLSWATRSAISSMRASSCASFCVSRHARIMPFEPKSERFSMAH
jgi:hypothetical protein